MSHRPLMITMLVMIHGLASANASGVEYEYRSSGVDPFVPNYRNVAKNEPTNKIADANKRFVLKGIWKASDSPWKAVVARRPLSRAESETSATVIQQPLTYVVGENLDAGVKIVSIEDQSVWVVESITLEDGRVFQKKSRIGFDEGE